MPNYDGEEWISPEKAKFKLENEYDLHRDVWEGWTPQDFINALQSEIHLIMVGATWRKPFKTKKKLANYIVNNQPYYKKPIPEVVDYFAYLYELE